MNRGILDFWRSRLRAADAVLAALSQDVRETLTTKTLSSTTETLRACLERLEETLSQLEDARRSLRTAEERYESFHRALPIAYVATTRSGEIIVSNPEASRMLNMSSRFLNGKSLVLFLEDREFWEATLRNLLTTDAPVRRSVILRPKERARNRILVYVSCPGGDTLQWFLFPQQSDAHGSGSMT